MDQEKFKHIKSSDHILWFNKAAESFEEALCTGNGRLGLTDYGNGQFLINEETLWSGKLGKAPYVADSKVLSTVREAIFDGRISEAESLVQESLLGPWKETYLPFGFLKLRFRGQTQLCHKRALDIRSGICTSSYDVYISKSYVPKKNNIMVIELEPITSDLTTEDLYQNISLTIEPALGYTESLREGNVYSVTGRCPSKVPSYDESSQEIEYDPLAKTIEYAFVCKVCMEDQKVILYMTISSNYEPYGQLKALDQDDLRTLALGRLEASMQKTSDDILRGHIEAMEAQFDMNTLWLASNDYSQLPTDERRLKYREDPTDYSLIGLYYHYGRYLLNQSSSQASLPANLQGIWNEHLRAPWCSNYTTNINLQMNYWHSQVCQIDEANDALINLLVDLAQSNDTLAVHHNLDVWFDIGPVNGSPSWAYWPMAGVWLAFHVAEHICKNPKPAYNQSLYNYLLKTAHFIKEQLTLDPEGHLSTCPSTSPENQYYTKDGYLASMSYSSVMDISLIEGFVGELSKVHQLWGLDRGLIDELELLLEQMPPIPIHEDGYLKEWQTEYLEKDIGHRHLSHLFGFFPGESMFGKGDQVIEAGRKALLRRIEDGGDFTSWHCAWGLCLLARFKEIGLAKNYLEIMIGELTCPNLLSSHRRKMDGEELFQIDGNFGGTRGIAEFMVQDYGERIRILTVMRQIVDEGQVKGLKIRKGHLIDLQWTKDYVAVAIRGSVDDLLMLEIEGRTYVLPVTADEIHSFRVNKKC